MRFFVITCIAFFWFTGLLFAEEAEPKWQADTGLQLSDFSRSAQPDWNQEFTQLTRFFNGRKTALHGKITRYDQFSNIDSEYEIGVDQVFAPRFNGYLYVAAAPDADFRPEWKAMGGGSVRLDNPAWQWWPVWMTLDGRYEDYNNTEATTLNPGLRIEPADRWAIAARAISIKQPDEKRVYGFDLRLDGKIAEDLRFYAGYADAPETVAGITVDTQTYFTGIAYDITPAHTLRLGYTHDDRENSYIRQVFDVSLSYSF